MRSLAAVIRQIQGHLPGAIDCFELLTLLEHVSETTIREYMRDPDAEDALKAFWGALLDRWVVVEPGFTRETLAEVRRPRHKKGATTRPTTKADVPRDVRVPVAPRGRK